MKSYLNFLRRNIGYTMINVLGFAVSLMFVIIIGAYAWQEMHIDSWHKKADRTYVFEAKPENEESNLGFNRLAATTLAQRFPEIETVCAITSHEENFRKPDGESIHTRFLLADSTFFDIFDFELLQGDRSKVLRTPQSIVVSEKFAYEYFGDTEDPTGKKIYFQGDSIAFTVSGMMKPMKRTMFLNPDRTSPDFIGNYALNKYFNRANLDFSNGTGALVAAVAKEGVDLPESAAAMEKDLTNYFWLFQRENESFFGKRSFIIMPIADAYLYKTRDRSVGVDGNDDMVTLMLAAAAVLLLFAVMNYVNLTVAQVSFRAKEMAMRRLLGSSKSDIAVRMFCESFSLVLASMLIGVILAFAALPYAEQILGLPIDLAMAVNPTTLGILTAVIFITSILSGIIPATIISAVRPIEVIKGTFRRKSKMWFSKIFITLQNIAAIFLIGCGLTVYEQTMHLINAPLGFNTDHIIVLDVFSDFENSLKEEISKLSCVEAISMSCGTPMDGGNNNTTEINGNELSMQFFIVDKAWFDIWGIKKDKDFGREGALVDKEYLTLATIENEKDSAEASIYYSEGSIYYFGERLPIGGIVHDFKIRNILERNHQMIVIPVEKVSNPWHMTIKVKGDEEEAWRQICKVYYRITKQDLDRICPTPYVDQMMAKVFEKEKQMAVILTIFSILTIIVSTLGLVGISTYFVNQRAREIAIRKVAGETKAGASWLMLRSFELYVLIAFLIAAPMIWYFMTQWLSKYTYRIPVYWWIYAVAGGICILTSLLAVGLQSYRAASVNPAHHLRDNS